MSSAEILAKYNEWRRGDDNSEMPDPTAIGIAIDSVLADNAALKEEKALLHAHSAELESQIAALKARVAELEAGAYESIMAFNATQDESLEAPELVDAVLAHAEAVRKLWNIWATRKGAEND